MPLDRDHPRDPNLLAVMVPSAGFGAVYETLKLAAADVGMTCVRADDIWEKEHILDDVVSLMRRADIVVADLTGKYPNVFYETGISHTIGRRLVPIAQSVDEVRFDLRSIRTLEYLNNAQRHADLRSRLVA